MESKDSQETPIGKNNLIINNFIIVIFSILSIFIEAIIIIISLFKKGIFKKEALSNKSDLGFDLIIKIKKQKK